MELEDAFQSGDTEEIERALYFEETGAIANIVKLPILVPNQITVSGLVELLPKTRPR